MTLEEKVIELSQNGFELGSPYTGIEAHGNGGRKQVFENATIYESTGLEAFEVHGAILELYQGLNEANSELGFPTSDEIDDLDVANGKMNSFESGSIRWNPEEGAIVYSHNSVNENDTLVEVLQKAANYAFSLLELSLEESKNQIFSTEHPSDANNWCGNTLAHIYKNVNFKKGIANKYFASTTGLLLYGSYNTLGFDSVIGNPLVFSQNEDTVTKSFHQENGALRKIILAEEILTGSPLDILPGDIVLFDHAKKKGPDHIQMVYEWYEDERILIVIDGNGGGFVLPESGAIPVAVVPNTMSKDLVFTQTKLDLISEKLNREIIQTNSMSTGRYGITCHILTNEHQITPPDSNADALHARVWAVIRPSILDFD